MPTAVDDDRTVDPLNDERNPVQSHYDKEFANLTSAEHLKKDGKPGDKHNSTKSDQSSVATNTSEKDGDNALYGGFYRQDEDSGSIKDRVSRLRNRVSKLSRRAKVGIGGGLLTGGIGISALFGLGSFQAIHLSQILSLDQLSNEQSSNLRMNALFRYARSGGAIGETRVSYLGSKKFASTRNQLANIGITFNENKMFGTTKGLIVDTNKFPETKGLSRDQARTKLVEFYKSSGISEADIKNVSGNKLYIDSRTLGISSTRKLVDNSVQALDGGKISTWTRQRVVKTYFNLPSAFHPIKKTEAKLNQKNATRVEAKQREKARKEAREYKSQTLEDARGKLKSNLTGAKAAAAGALLVTSGICLARDSADEAVIFNREAIVIPQTLEAVDRIAVGAQQQSGMDFDASQLGDINQLSTDEDGRSIWDARALQAKTNPYASEGEDLPWDYGQAFSGGGTANTLKELGGTAGSWACSPVGVTAQAIGGIALIGFAPFTGGGTAAALGALKVGTQAAVGAAVMIGLQNLLTNALKEDAIPDDISAPLQGNLLAYGSRELANINARAAGGVELSSEESMLVDSQIANSSKQEFLAKPLFAQLFDASDYRSITGQVVNSMSTPKQELKNLASSLLNMGPRLASTFSSLLPSVQAATPYEYGFNRYGIPARILNNEAYADPYENADIVADLLNSDTGKDYIDRASKCFGVTLEMKNALWAVTPAGDVNPQSSEYEDARCNDASDPNWDRLMLFVKDSSEIEAAACYLGEEDSCETLGVIASQQVCSIDSTSVAGMPDWVKMPVINAKTGSAVRGNVNMAIANIKEGKDVANGLRIMAERNLDFIALNEVGETSLRDMEATIPAYGAYRENQRDPDDGGQSLNNAILWRKDVWKFVDGGRIKITDKDHTFAQGNPRVWSRYAIWSVFERKSDGAIVPVIVTHAMTNPAKFPRQHGNPPMTRIQQYSLSMDILVQLTAQLSQYGPVLIAGDMNSHDNQGDWSAVSKLKSIGYNYAHDGAVVYIFNPKGTKVLDSLILSNVKSPGDSHPGAVVARIDMNGAGPGSIDGAPSSVTSSTSDCAGSGGSGSVTPGSVKMEDDYAKECGDYTSCTGQCVDFVKFRLKKYIDASKFNDFTTGTGGVAAYTSSENLGKQYGYKVDNTPAVNSVVSWPAGGVPGSGANDTYGHVAMVSKVNADGSIVVEEYNATIPAETYGTRTIPASAAKLLTYAHTEVDFK